MDGTDPDQVARAILSHLRDAAPQGDAAKRNARLRSLLRDLKLGEGVGRALLAVSRDLGLRRTGRLLPLLYSSQEKGSINRLTYLLLTLAHGHIQQGDKEPKDLTKALGLLTNGVVETWEAEDIPLQGALTFARAIVSPDEQDVAKLLRVIPRSSYFSLAEGKEYQPGSIEWSPRELGGLVGQLKHERAERRDLEFFMDILVKEGGWGREKSVAPAEATSDSPATTTQRKDLPKSSKPTVAYDLDYVPKVVGPALAPFFDYWGNQDYATVIQCLITAFSQHAVATYGQQTLTKEQYHDFCMEMMAQTAISSKPTVGMLHYMINDITSGWEEHDVDALSTRLEARMKPHSFFRRWFRKLFNQPTPN
ncbi:uncharacterized protein ACA1_325140 [Acanthamoeba castellanii str. Neff]|uniref:Uncharacterized protein n=1 Tax=Acanthamoeba castellanii (strain ATCC 30010 / Neff) TaxID=1257118 RepID=L8GNY4_ACACF|nr:uncharacterized protein ACA1_325140 [Acanthamoeba castellanii str. Neff]ELR14899.1 hypothetical protein ACA1_325140 [Acanthamoeba castellanii str. Neff]